MKVPNSSISKLWYIPFGSHHRLSNTVAFFGRVLDEECTLLGYNIPPEVYYIALVVITIQWHLVVLDVCDLLYILHWKRQKALSKYHEV